MTAQPFDRSYAGTAAENYQRYFVPSIGGPLAEDLIAAADLRPGERVLDIACGTGVVARLAAERVGETGSVAGLDPNPGMLAVARAETPPGDRIDWHEASAEAMPLPDEAFDVVLCQMGLQFIPDKAAALAEMRRVLVGGGRVCLNVPGPRPALFGIMADALARHLGPKAAGFVDLVFSLHDADELAGLMRGAGFREVDVRAAPKDLRLPAPADFFRQYLHSTPVAAIAAEADPSTREALEREVSAQWQAFAADGAMQLRLGVTTGSALK